MAKLTHIDAEGQAAMVDVSDKDVTERIATATGSVVMAPETLRMIVEGATKKGDVLSVAGDVVDVVQAWTVCAGSLTRTRRGGPRAALRRPIPGRTGRRRPGAAGSPGLR